MKICCIVNDVASVNIDSKLVKNHDKAAVPDAPGETGNSSEVETVELQNGCVCCSSSDELAQAVLQVASKPDTKFDHIIVEATGVAEPKGVRNMFLQLEAEDHQLTQLVYLRCMITVVDSEDFLAKYKSKETIDERPDLGENTYEIDRKVVDLLTEQVECADFVICNKTDKVGQMQMAALKDIVKALNPSAQVMNSTFGKGE